MPTFTASDGFPIAPAGIYPFEVLEATEKTAKTGNAMIGLKLRIFGEEQYTVFDNLVFTQSAAWKITEFMRAVGYEVPTGTDAALEAYQCLGKTGEAQIGVRSYEGRDQNTVASYLASGVANPLPTKEPAPAKAKALEPAEIADDDLPF